MCSLEEEGQLEVEYHPEIKMVKSRILNSCLLISQQTSLIYQMQPRKSKGNITMTASTCAHNLTNALTGQLKKERNTKENS